MRKFNIYNILLGLSFVCLFMAVNAYSQQSNAVNLAVAATPASSYVSGDTSLQALLDGATPRNSADNRRGSYGNWPRTGTQWVEYRWSQPIATRTIDVYWWKDGRGIDLPRACRLKYWDGADYTEVKNAKGLGVARDRFNTTTFDEVRTDRLRLEIDSNGTFSSGILDWRVYDSGKSPKFPPAVAAGAHRVVIRGGRTWLAGQVTLLQGGEAKLAWSKLSGPGEVAFENPAALETVAKFSALGDYVLQLTAIEGALSSASTLQVAVQPPPPAQALAPVATKAFKVNSPLWSARVKALVVGWIPHCVEKLAEPALPEGGLDNFVQAGAKLAGKSFTPRHGPPWADAYTHNTIESICIALMVDPQGDSELIAAQKALRATLEAWIPKILSAQEPDGYLQTRFTLDPRNAPHWNPRTRGDHEGYVAGYFIEAALAHYVMTNKTDARLYKAARKLADCWCANIGPAPKKEWYDGHEEMEQALLRLGRFVNENEGAGQGKKYLDLAKFLLDCRGGGSSYDQSHVPVTRQYEALGHAVRAAYCYAAMAGVANETGDIDYRSAVQSLWDSIVNRKYYVTGGIGSGETSEGFGPDYSLRNNAYCESCSNCGELFFQHQLNLTWHDARYADLLEDTLYNAILGDIDLAGKNFYYQNPLEGGGPRYPWHGCPCCVGNIPRVLLSLPTWIYAKSPDSLYVNLFIGSTVNVEGIAGTSVELTQTTAYPWQGQVAITVKPASPKRFSVRVRVPSRNVSALYRATPDVPGITAFAVNGQPLQPPLENGYAVITREWKAGDTIALELPLTPQRIKASEKIAADLGRVALRVGPMIYNIEHADQPDLTKILAPGAPLATEWRADLLGGVLAVKGAFADGSPLLAIPNYARNNRLPASAAGGRKGPGGRTVSSTVWIRDRE